jgi:hypothetical protein
VSSIVQTGSGTIGVPATVDVPGTLSVTATAGTTPGDVTGFVVLTRGADVRRIPFWFAVSAPRLALEAMKTLTKPGTFSATTRGGPARVSVYRYPTGGDIQYPGPERAFRFSVKGRPANVGVVVLSGRAVPHVVFDKQEDHLAGYTGLPVDLNPYRSTYGRDVRVAGIVLPGAGVYDFVFDSRSKAEAGPFTFHWWVNDTKPPRLQAVPSRGAILVRATDAGSGVDPTSAVVTLDGKEVTPQYIRSGATVTFTVKANAGSHSLVFQVGDYQENKNMEDVGPILPNTARLETTASAR